MEINPLSLGEQIEIALREEILEGKLRPGQRLSLQELAQRWEVSSMPVRDAVRRLESSGFLVVAPRSGIYVAKFDKDRFKNILDIRIALECLAVELSIHLIPDAEIEAAIAIYQDAGGRLEKTGDATALIDQDNLVHNLIFKHCANPELIETMRGIQHLIHWGHRIAAASHPDAFVRALPEHLAILDALRHRNVEEARSAMQTHLTNTLQRTFEGWDDKQKTEENLV